eukprot:TRINITY_DN48024_c0_g1_i1.p1 TRINITY_DN48024_c0_g1~~TRINITY_DN48024_c0_g1_i1.p1  ORF type:complete len:146 (+),score=35.38 TRINITY_DN48024_c0_g1_i1:66-503(+)
MPVTQRSISPKTQTPSGVVESVLQEPALRSPHRIIAMVIGILLLAVVGPKFLCDEGVLQKELDSRTNQLNKLRQDVLGILKDADMKLQADAANREAAVKRIEEETARAKKRLIEVNEDATTLKARVSKLRGHSNTLKQMAIELAT